MMEEALATLNGPQREVVLDFDHTLLVLAGAGSGKTRTVTTKIAYALNVIGLKPWQILAVTFTNKAANEMRSRIEAMLGPGCGAEDVMIRTFHSFGAWLLRVNADKMGLPSSFTIYDDSDSQNLVSSLEKMDASTARKVARSISLFKDRGVTPFDDEVLSCNAAPNFRSLYRRYEERLEAAGCVDFADLVVKSLRLLKEHPDVKEHMHRRFRLVLVDEYQDSNASQFEFLKELVGPDSQLVVVGDDDQSIYRFRGAEVKNMLQFEQAYDNVRTIRLEENYRSTKNIIAASGALIAHNRGRHEKTLFTNNEAGSLPKVINCFNAEDEAMQVVSRISDRLGRSDCAVLYRTNAQSQAFENVLTQRGIKYQVVGGLRFFEREEVKDMLSLFALLLNPYNEVAFRRVVNKPARGVGAATVEKVLSHGGDTFASMEAVLQEGGLSSKAKAGLTSFLTICRKAVEDLASGTVLSAFATKLVVDTGFKAYYEKDDDRARAESKIQNLNTLVSSLDSYGSGTEGLSTFLESVTLDTSVMPGAEGRISPDKDVVKLITMHNTKGLEFDSVFVTGLEDDLIPGRRNSDDDEEVEEERRILYVAMTRARKELFLSWSAVRLLWGEKMYQKPTRYFRDIPEGLLDGRPAIPRGFSGSSASSYTSRYAYEPRYSRKPVGEDPVIFHEPPVKKVERKENTNTFRAGDRVNSPDYGPGTIAEVDMRKADRVIIRVAFDNGRKSVFNARFCNLEKI